MYGPKSGWEDQKPDLTAENADEVIRVLDDILLHVEEGLIEVGYDSIYRPEWDRSKVPGLVSFSLPSVGIEVSIGRDRGGSWSRTGEDGQRESGKYEAPVDIQVSIPLKVDFLGAGEFINLWFDGQKGEHEQRVLDAVVRLRERYLDFIDWYFSLVETEIPMLIDVAKAKLSSSAAARRGLLSRLAAGSEDDDAPR